MAVAGGPAPTATASLPPVASRDAQLVELGVGHIFVIVLENESYKDAYVHNKHHYLGRALQKQGTLLTHYYGIGHYSLDNYLAIISGQAPNPVTSQDCMHYSKFKPSSHPLKINKHGQAVGTGCLYPSRVLTLADQLETAGVTWGGFMDHMGAKRGREAKTCGQPTLLKHHVDGTQIATKKDQYAARHNPFVYFHSLLNSGLCDAHVLKLGALPPALANVETTPRFSFITPDLCNDGHDKPCKGTDSAGSHKGGLASVDHFLKKWVPIIQASPAYQQDGVLIITSDESEGSDSTSCCNERPGPKEKKPGLSGPGGGRVGTLVLGGCVAPDVKDPTPYNHYSLLRSLEDLFGITTGGTDGAGHLGYAAEPDLQPFGLDVFAPCSAMARS
jgi:hypothetical protein